MVSAELWSKVHGWRVMPVWLIGWPIDYMIAGQKARAVRHMPPNNN